MGSNQTDIRASYSRAQIGSKLTPCPPEKEKPANGKKSGHGPSRQFERQLVTQRVDSRETYTEKTSRRGLVRLHAQQEREVTKKAGQGARGRGVKPLITAWLPSSRPQTTDSRAEGEKHREKEQQGDTGECQVVAPGRPKKSQSRPIRRWYGRDSVSDEEKSQSESPHKRQVSRDAIQVSSVSGTPTILWGFTRGVPKCEEKKPV